MNQIPEPIPDLDDPEVVEVTADGPRLVASRCLGCDALDFPARTICRVCLGTDFGRELLSGDGTLYAFTTIHTAGEPYTVGYVDLPAGPRAFGHVRSPEGLRPDIPVSLTGTGAPLTFVAEEASRG